MWSTGWMDEMISTTVISFNEEENRIWFDLKIEPPSERDPENCLLTLIVVGGPPTRAWKMIFAPDDWRRGQTKKLDVGRFVRSQARAETFHHKEFLRLNRTWRCRRWWRYLSRISSYILHRFSLAKVSLFLSAAPCNKHPSPVIFSIGSLDIVNGFDG